MAAIISRQVVIVGGGISGLATAFYLLKQGIRSTIIDPSDQLGGLIRTDNVQGCELEAGPDSFISTKPALAELAADLKISGQLIGSNDAERRIYIVKNGKLTPMPKGMVMMVPGEWQAALRSSLFSLATRTRFLREWFTPPRQRPEDFSIRDLVVDHFGKEALAYVTEPLLAGVYGGHAAALSAPSVLPRFVEHEKQYGSLIKGVRRSKSQSTPGQSLFLSFKGGMQTLIDKLVESLHTEVEVIHGRATCIQRTPAEWHTRVDGQNISSAHVVLACSAHSSAALVTTASSELSRLLSEIPYSSSTLVTLLFRKEEFTYPLNGFGFLVPEPERQTLAAVTWINTKFPSRVAAGTIALRAFLVDPEATQHAQTAEGDLVNLVLSDLQRLMNIHCKPSYARVYRWPNSMPQYVIGHARRCVAIAQATARLSGLHLSSNYLDGVGIPDCVRLARVTAQKIVTT